MSYGELWRVTSGLGTFIFGCCRKLFRKALPLEHGFSHPESITVIDFDQLPTKVNEALRPAIEECETLGLRRIFCHTVPTIGKIQGFTANSLSQDGTVWASVAWVSVQSGIRYRERVIFGCCSKLQDGRILATSNSKLRLNTPPGIEAVRLHGRSISDVVFRHRDRMACTLTCSPLCLDESGVRAAINEIRRRTAEFNFKRGVWVPMTRAEIEKLRGEQLL